MKLSNAFISVEQGLNALYAYIDAKENDKAHIDDRKNDFIKFCKSGDVCQSSLKTLVAAINGQDLDSSIFGCDLPEMIFEGAPSI